VDDEAHAVHPVPLFGGPQNSFAETPLQGEGVGLPGLASLTMNALKRPPVGKSGRQNARMCGEICSSGHTKGVSLSQGSVSTLTK
jgi:hypothetical protein